MCSLNGIPFVCEHLQCVCSWEDRDRMFAEVEGIIKRQINVKMMSPQIL